MRNQIVTARKFSPVVFMERQEVGLPGTPCRTPCSRVQKLRGRQQRVISQIGDDAGNQHVTAVRN